MRSRLLPPATFLLLTAVFLSDAAAKQSEPTRPKIMMLKNGDRVALTIPKKGVTATFYYEGGKAMTATFTATPPAGTTVTYKIGFEEAGKITERNLPTQKGANLNLGGTAGVGLTEDQRSVKFIGYEGGPAKVPVRVVVSNDDGGIKVVIVPDIAKAK